MSYSTPTRSFWSADAPSQASTINPESIRLSGVVDSFIGIARAQRTLTGESIEKYRSAVAYFSKTMGDMPVQAITTETLVTFQCRLADVGVGPSHVNGVIYAIKRLVDHCRQRLGMSVADLTSVRALSVPRRTVTYLTPDELEQFVSAIRVQRRDGEANLHVLGFRALVEVLVGSGMRVSEALALDVSAVNWQAHEARIVGKGGKDRAVFFTARAMRWLKRSLESRVDRNQALFVTGRARKRLARHEAQRLCRVYAARSGLGKRITLHVLRHTYATTLLRNGCPIGHIKGLLGHERLETTCHYYLGILNDTELKKAHERFLDW
jgi:integrase/recombinase XerD